MDDNGRTTDYADDMAALAQRIDGFAMRLDIVERALASQAEELARLKAGTQRMADYQGVTHLLTPERPV